MIPADFPESNMTFKRPPDMEESQCLDVRGYVAPIKGGSLDGARVIVTAWQPDEEERKAIAEGKPIFMSSIGVLPPHFLTTEFAAAIAPK